jgi:hypothetical protein
MDLILEATAQAVNDPQAAERLRAILLPQSTLAVVPESHKGFTVASQDDEQRLTALTLIREMQLAQKTVGLVAHGWLASTNLQGALPDSAFAARLEALRASQDGLVGLKPAAENLLERLKAVKAAKGEDDDEAASDSDAEENSVNGVLRSHIDNFHSFSSGVERFRIGVMGLVKARLETALRASATTLMEMLPQGWEDYGIERPDKKLIRSRLVRNPYRNDIEPACVSFSGMLQAAALFKQIDDYDALVAEVGQAALKARKYVSSAALISLIHLRKDKLSSDELKAEAESTKAALKERGMWFDKDGVWPLHDTLRAQIIDILEE